MTPRLLTTVLASLVAASAIALMGCDRGDDAASTASATAAANAGPRRVVALGRIEPAGGVIAISAIPGERLKSFAEGVVEGGEVAPGKKLAELASYDLRSKQLEAVDEKLQLAKNQDSQELAVARAQRAQAVAALAQAEAKLEEVNAQRLQLDNLGEAAAIAMEDYRRLEQLRENDPDLVTEHQLRRRKNVADRAGQEYASANSAYTHGLQAALKGVEAAKANVELAEANVDFAEKVDQVRVAELERAVAVEMREQSILRAPPGDADAGESDNNYTVLKIFTRPGEFVAQFPVLQLGDLSEMVCIAEVYEADTKELARNQQVSIRSPAFDGVLAKDGEGVKGEVVRIGSLIGSPGLSNRNPLAPSDRSVVEVRIKITDDRAEALEQLRKLVGLQVTVEFGDKPAAATNSQPAPSPSAPPSAATEPAPAASPPTSQASTAPGKAS